MNSLPLPDPLPSMECLAEGITESKKMQLSPQRYLQLALTLHKPTMDVFYP